MNKKCSSCKETKTIDNFSLNKYKKDGSNDSCKICHSLYRKDHYIKNKQKYIDKAKINSDKSVDRFIEFLKDKSCMDCGNDNPVVLEFDHKRDKIANISKLIRSASKEKLENEIDKCEVVCANCHRIRTAKQFNWKKYAEMV